MRTAQDQRIHARFLQRSEVLARHRLNFFARGHPGLDEVDESRARLLAHRQPGHGRERTEVCLGLDGCLRSDNANMVVAGGDDALSGGRSNDLDDGDAGIDPVAFASIREGSCRRCIAGDDEGLHAARGQLVESGERQRAHLRNSARTVRRVLGVAQVDDLFIGQFIDDCARNRQPT